MQMWREKTNRKILPEATPRRHCLLCQTLSPLARTHSLGGRRKGRGSFLTLEISGMCGDYRMEVGSKTSLACFTSSILARVLMLVSTYLHRPGAEMEPSGATTLCQATVLQPSPPQSWWPNFSWPAPQPDPPEHRDDGLSSPHQCLMGCKYPNSLAPRWAKSELPI